MSAYFSHVTSTGDELTLRMYAKHREGHACIDSLTIEARDSTGSTHATFQATRQPIVLIGERGDPTKTTALAALMAAPDMLALLRRIVTADKHGDHVEWAAVVAAASDVIATVDGAERTAEVAP